MKIYTGNFANLKKYQAAGLHPISIALTARYFTGYNYRALNPDRSFMMDTEEFYTPKYEQKLKLINARNVFNDLEKIGNGKNIVLLCHEGENDFCHRRLVASWLSREIGIEVLELGKMQKDNQKLSAPSLFNAG